MDMTDSNSWLPELIIKHMRKLFCQTYYFNFQSNQDNFFIKHIVLISSLIRTVFLSIYKNIVRILVWHTKSEKHKSPKKKVNEELWRGILEDGGIFACQKMRKKK